MLLIQQQFMVMLILSGRRRRQGMGEGRGRGGEGAVTERERVKDNGKREGGGRHVTIAVINSLSQRLRK